jgi:hypothetical protein
MSKLMPLAPKQQQEEIKRPEVTAIIQFLKKVPLFISKLPKKSYFLNQQGMRGNCFAG